MLPRVPLTGGGVQQPPDAQREEGRGGSNTAAPSALEESSGSARHQKAAPGRVLFSAERIRTVQPLWQVVRAQLARPPSQQLQAAGPGVAQPPAAGREQGGPGDPSSSRAADVLVSRPLVDCSLDERGELRLARMLRLLGLLASPPPLPAAAAAAPGAGTAAAATAWSDLEETEEYEEGGESQALGPRAPGGPGSTVGSAAAASGVAAGAKAADSSWPPPSFLAASSPVGFTGELRDQGVNVFLADGALLVPREARCELQHSARWQLWLVVCGCGMCSAPVHWQGPGAGLLRCAKFRPVRGSHSGQGVGICHAHLPTAHCTWPPPPPPPPPTSPHPSHSSPTQLLASLCCRFYWRLWRH